MKGLILSAMNRKEEALDLARKGLKNDFRSGTCWHVYGLILRAEKKYDDAIKVNRGGQITGRANKYCCISTHKCGISVAMSEYEIYFQIANTRFFRVFGLYKQWQNHGAKFNHKLVDHISG